MVHLLSIEEVPRLIPLGRLFFAESGSAGEFNPVHFASAWSKSIRVGTGLVLVVDDPGRGIKAALGGAVWQCPNTGDLIAAETFYYAHPDHRGSGLKLLPAFEAEVKRRGAKRVWMVRLTTPGSERIDTLYARRGYKLREVLHEKQL